MADVVWLTVERTDVTMTWRVGAATIAAPLRSAKRLIVRTFARHSLQLQTLVRTLATTHARIASMFHSGEMLLVVRSAKAKLKPDIGRPRSPKNRLAKH